MYNTLHQALAAFDEYPVENFRSLLRARTNATDNTDQISLKAKEIDTCKQEVQPFQAMFMPTKKFYFTTLVRQCCYQNVVGKKADNQMATTKFFWKHGCHQPSSTKSKNVS